MMKKTFLQYSLITFLTLLLLSITIIVGCSKDDITGTTKHCTDATYPLWCPDAKVCCPRGYAHYCDGNCYQTGCPSGTVTMDDCAAE